MTDTNSFIYSGENTREISFPLGGIGTGCIGLAGNGQLIDVEIFGHPNKGSNASLTHFAIKTEDENDVLDTRVLVSDYLGCRTGSFGGPGHATFGTGPDHRATFSGFPHFRSSRFEGTFPLAKIHFEDTEFPGNISMEAFNPFIPSDSENSSLPAAFFAFNIVNTQDRTLKYTLAFSVKNLYTDFFGKHSIHKDGDVTSIHLQNSDYAKDDIRFGDLCVSTDSKEVQCQRYWYRGMWFDNLITFWNDFSSPGPLKDRVYPFIAGEHEENQIFDTCTLAASLTLAPGDSGRLKFVLSWNTPNMRNTWNPRKSVASKEPDNEHFRREWKQYYATRFSNSLASGRYAMHHFDNLLDRTKRFTHALFSSTLPAPVLDAVSSNLAILKSPTCLRLEDGSLYGFEGCGVEVGSCEGSCTHVWSYAYALAFLFPDLERSMRTLEYRYSMRSSGAMSFRLMLPPGRSPWEHRPCADGQFATVMRVLREYRISGDKKWLRSIWPEVKRSIQYAWSNENYDKWDPGRRGVLSGRQHHTLDMELFGESSWLTGLYLGALKAGAILACAMGDTDSQREFEEIFEHGQAYLNQSLFNGEYFIQKIDLNDKSLLDEETDIGHAPDEETVVERYWNAENEEIKYQIGTGCGIDQVLGQWHADLIGIGDIFDVEKVNSSLHAIYKYNFVPNMRRFVNPCRLFCMNDEGGLVICSYPQKEGRPLISVPYAQETMNGFEYQAASHMLLHGMEKEGLECLSAVRQRYDGKTRNPWNEFECGSNYARSLASYALLLAYSGFQYDMSQGSLGFSPLGGASTFRCFWSLDGVWGTMCYTQDSAALVIEEGRLKLRHLRLSNFPFVPSTVTVDENPESPIDFSLQGNQLHFSKDIILCDTLHIF